MTLALYELSQGYQNLLGMVDEESPDIDIINALTVIEGAIEVKAGNIAHIIKTLESEAINIKEEEKRLSLRRKARENTVTNMKQYLQDAMTQMGLDKIKTPTRTISIQVNPPAVQIIDEDVIPGKFLTLIPEHYEVNKKLISEALKAGEEVKGAELSRGKSLRIR
jgi:hypothetical protein